jgi:signal transduction histidine kinase
MAIPATIAGASGGPRVGDAPGWVLQRRMALVLWIVVGGNLVFAATDPWLNPNHLAALTALKAVLIAVQVAGLIVLRRPLSRRAAVAVALICGGVAAAAGTIASVIVGDPFTTPLLCASATLITAAVIPWGAAVQLAVALMNLTAGTLAVWLVAGADTAHGAIVALAVSCGLSVYIARELDRQRRAEAQAKLALQRHQAELAHVLRVSAMGEMAAQLAHELTQPLGAIANYAAGSRRRLEASPEPPSEVIDVIDHISREALRAGAIIRRLREFLQKSEPRRTPVDVNGLVHEVVELIEGEARERGVGVDLALHPALPMVEADAVEIEQVLVNLARNALEAMQQQANGAPATLSIETRTNGAAVEVFVRDTGPGLGAGDVQAIFEPFYTTKPGGLGMGLAICRTIVELHGGTLAASSGPRGATFHFTLPVESA